MVRHGESEANIDKAVHEIKPDYAAELPPQGITQADAARADMEYYE